MAERSAPRARAEAEAQVFNQMVVALQERFGGSVTPRAPQIERECAARNRAAKAWRDIGRSDFQPAGMREHLPNITRVASPHHHIVWRRSQGDKPFWSDRVLGSVAQIP